MNVPIQLCVPSQPAIFVAPAPPKSSRKLPSSVGRMYTSRYVKADVLALLVILMTAYFQVVPVNCGQVVYMPPVVSVSEPEHGSVMIEKLMPALVGSPVTQQCFDRSNGVMPEIIFIVLTLSPME